MKRTVDDLAIFGGPSEFQSPLHVGRPNLGDRGRTMERIAEVLDSGWLTNDGPCVREFEARVAEIAGMRHCVAVSSGTMALELVFRGLGLTGEVILPSFTFISTAHALLWQGITPVFCDIDPESHNIDPARVEELITPRTSAIVGVHMWGRPCNVEALQSIARRHHLRLVFDAAHAFGSCHNGQRVGQFGDAEIFSFHATKFINTGEGGAVVTNDEQLAAKLRGLHNFGFVDYDLVGSLGTNGKLNEVSAAMGLSSLDSMDEFIRINRTNYEGYRRGLAQTAGVSIAQLGAGGRNYQYVVLEIDEDRAGLSRDDLLRVLSRENVLARRYFYPGCHRSKPYVDLFPGLGGRLPHTETLCSRVLCLPNGQSVGADEIERLCAVLRFSLEHGAEIRTRMNEVAEK